MKFVKAVLIPILIIALMIISACSGGVTPSPIPSPIHDVSISPEPSPTPDVSASPDPVPTPPPTPEPDPTDTPPPDAATAGIDGGPTPGGVVFDISAVDISGIDPDMPVVALTFDDGPNTTITVMILDKIEQHGVVATFFLEGRHIKDSSIPVMQRAFDMGCEFGNHSWSHIDLSKKAIEEIEVEVRYTSDKIEQALGVRPFFFRPPYIATSNTMYEVIDLPFISGVMAGDWSTTDSELIAERILNQTNDGVIILLHDGPSFSGTPDSLDIIIPELLDRGYQFVTLSQLFAVKGVTPEIRVNGKIYSEVG